MYDIKELIKLVDRKKDTIIDQLKIKLKDLSEIDLLQKIGLTDPLQDLLREIGLLQKIDLLQNKRFRHLLKMVIDTPGMKLPLDQQPIEAFCDELKQDGIEITPTKLQKEIEVGLVKYVIQELVRVAVIADMVWPKWAPHEQIKLEDNAMGGLYTLLEQKGIKASIGGSLSADY